MSIDRSNKIELANQLVEYAKALIEKDVSIHDAYNESAEVFSKRYPDLEFDIIEEYDKEKDAYIITTVGVT